MPMKIVRAAFLVAVCLFTVGGCKKADRRSAEAVHLSLLDSHIQLWTLSSTRYPDTLREVVDEDLGTDLLDQWGNTVAYTRVGDGYTLISAGADGKLGTDDDLVHYGPATSGMRIQPARIGGEGWYSLGTRPTGQVASNVYIPERSYCRPAGGAAPRSHVGTLNLTRTAARRLLDRVSRSCQLSFVDSLRRSSSTARAGITAEELTRAVFDNPRSFRVGQRPGCLGASGTLQPRVLS